MPYVIDSPPAGINDPATQRYLRHLHREVEKLGNVVMGAKNGKPIKEPKSVAAEGTVQNLLGQTAQPQVGQATYETALPASTDPLSQPDALISLYDNLYRYDDPTMTWTAQGPGKVATYTQVTVSANTTADQLLMPTALKAGQANFLNRAIRIDGAGIYSTAAGQTPTLRFRLIIGASVLIEWIPITTTAAAGNMPWCFSATLITSSTGPSGGWIVTGWCAAVPGTVPGGVASVAIGQNTGFSPAFDMTSALTIQTVGRYSTGNAGNAITQLSQVSEVLN